MFIFEIFIGIVDLLERIIFFKIFGFPLLVLMLMFTSIFFSVYLGFPNIKLFKKSLKYINENDNNTLLKSKQSFFTSLSSIVGMGSIAGVATAIYVGGSGAVFWIVVLSLFSMNMSFAETLLAIKYKNVSMEDKSVECAPVYYIKHSLKDNKYVKLGAILSLSYAIMYFVGLLGSQMYQVEEFYNSLSNFKIFAENKFIVMAIFDIMILVIIYGGITGITKIFEKLLPFACGLYVISVLIILICNITNLPNAIYTILIEAFKLKSVTGGIVGAICTGIQRGIYSSEAGLGAATTPYVASSSGNPIKRASVGALNPLFVSMMCLLTGLIIVSSGAYVDGLENGVVLVNKSFLSVASWFPYILNVVIFLLSTSVCISSAFNAQNLYNYCFGKKTTFVFMVLQFVAIISTVYLDLNKVISIGDTLYLSIAIPNILCLFLVRKTIKNTYLENVGGL